MFFRITAGCTYNDYAITCERTVADVSRSPNAYFGEVRRGLGVARRLSHENDMVINVIMRARACVVSRTGYKNQVAEKWFVNIFYSTANGVRLSIVGFRGFRELNHENRVWSRNA